MRSAPFSKRRFDGARLGVHEHTVGKWRRRFVRDRIEGLTDESRPGRPRTVSDTQVAEVIERTLNTTPRDATHWSIRSMAASARASSADWNHAAVGLRSFEGGSSRRFLLASVNATPFASPSASTCKLWVGWGEGG